ncbi:precorrin-3B synthase [Dongia sp.]|uniref:precorrin-3B synthase n=1 Tax=Dongia sp. TaxID=1977262 RepID=UPI0035AF022E
MIVSDRRFACPGLYRIVPSLDGGICRIKLPRGRLNAAQARALAGLADRFGHPEIEATNRANVQIRGVRAGSEDAVIEGLTAAGLAPGSSSADDVRNVMVSPLCGLDPDAPLDVGDLADRVLTRLENEPRYHALSPKFSVQIDGGETVAMAAHPNDIWFSAIDGETFAFGFAGVPGEKPAGAVAAGDAERALFALLDLFVAEIGKTNAKGEKVTRMRHLLVGRRAEAMAAALPCPVRAASDWRREEPMALGHIGARRQVDGRFALGAVPPLGRIPTRMLLDLAELATDVAGGEIRMTPWQSVLLPNIDEDALANTAARLEELGFITRPDRTLAATVTCAGGAGCRSGLTDTKADALALAAEIDGWGTPIFGIHVTGCSKSCAAPRPAPFTLLGLKPGRYDLFAAAESTGGDGPMAGFGERVGRDLTIEQAARLLMPRLPMQREKA